jgi:hypothetical protein
MDFEKVIDNIRVQINNLNNVDHLKELTKTKEIKSLSNYYQNSKIKSFEYGMKKKNRSSYKEPIEKKKEYNILEEEQTMEMIEKEIESLKYNDWDKLLINIQNDRLNCYVDTIPSMSSVTKKKLKKELNKMLHNRKLTSKKISYNKEEGQIQEISDLVFNKINDSFTFKD